MTVRVRTAAVAIALAAISSGAYAQTNTEDREAVRLAAVDYVEGIYNVQPERIERSVHPTLVKRGFYKKDAAGPYVDRKSTRLNSSHSQISYAVFCLKKKKKKKKNNNKKKKKKQQDNNTK